MAHLAKQRLAQRLLQNWLTKNPLDSNNAGVSNIDDSLQSLGWLLNQHNGSSTETTKSNSQVLPVAEVKVAAHYAVNRTSVLQPVMVNPNTQQRVHRINPHVKPTHSYSTLITMAINNTKEKKTDIASIYKWISDNFPFYKLAECHWKNSIRHNLSLSQRFEKVPRLPNEPGKGGFWRMKTSSGVTETTSRKRSMVSIMPLAKRFNMDDDASAVRNDVSWYVGEQRKDAENTSKNDFQWSAALPRDIYVDGVQIKTENILDDDDYSRTTQSPMMPFGSSDVDDDGSRSSFPGTPSSPIKSEDLSCFDDLLVFNFPDKSKDQQLDDVALDLTVTADGSGDHDWWQKAFDFSEESDVVREKKKVKRDDCTDIFISPLDQELDICDMFSMGEVF